jgi:hypothetical protein
MIKLIIIDTEGGRLNMVKTTGWKDIDTLILNSHQLLNEGSSLKKEIDKANKFSPKSFKRSRKVRVLSGINNSRSQ